LPCFSAKDETASKISKKVGLAMWQSRALHDLQGEWAKAQGCVARFTPHRAAT
jgi:hypothetical protein